MSPVHDPGLLWRSAGASLRDLRQLRGRGARHGVARQLRALGERRRRALAMRPHGAQWSRSDEGTSGHVAHCQDAVRFSGPGGPSPGVESAQHLRLVCAFAAERGTGFPPRAAGRQTARTGGRHESAAGAAPDQPGKAGHERRAGDGDSVADRACSAAGSSWRLLNPACGRSSRRIGAAADRERARRIRRPAAVERMQRRTITGRGESGRRALPFPNVRRFGSLTRIMVEDHFDGQGGRDWPRASGTPNTGRCMHRHVPVIGGEWRPRQIRRYVEGASQFTGGRWIQLACTK